MDSMRVAVVAADPELLEAVRRLPGVGATLEIAVEISEITPEELDELQGAQLDAILVDLRPDPELAMQFAEYLIEEMAVAPVLVAGPEPTTNVLLELMQAGVAEYVVTPLQPGALEGALERVLRRHGPTRTAAREEEDRRGRIYAVVGAKGGVGATMIATNLALELRRLTRERVLLLDLDFLLGDACLQLRLEPRQDVVDVIDNLARMDAELLESFVARHASGIAVLASPQDERKASSLGTEQVRELLDFLRGHYEHLVVDAPMPYAAHAPAAFGEADHVLLVTTPDVPSLRNASRVLDSIRRAAQGSDGKIELVVNRFDSSRSVPAREIEGLIGIPVRGTLANDYETVLRAINTGHPVGESERSPVARDLRVLATALVGTTPAAPARGTAPALVSRLSLLARLRKAGSRRA